MKVMEDHVKAATKLRKTDIMLALLAEPGTDANEKHDDGAPLIYAVRTGNLEMALTVFGAGADVSKNISPSTSWNTAMDAAMNLDKEDIAQTFLDHGAMMSPCASLPHLHRDKGARRKGIRALLEKEERKRDKC